MEIGSEIRAHREKQGLSQKALAKRAGLNKSTIERVELGRGRPRAATIAKVLAALNLELEGDTIVRLDGPHKLISKTHRGLRQLFEDWSKKPRNAESESYVKHRALDPHDGTHFGQLSEVLETLLATGHSVIILGEPGAGKSAFCRQFVFEQGNKWLSKPNFRRFPILFRLDRYSPREDLVSWMATQLKRASGLPEDEFRDLLFDECFVPIFDGFDEMSLALDETVAVEAIEQFENLKEKGCPLILTSREAYIRSQIGQSKLGAFELLRLQSFTNDQVADFVRTNVSGHSWIGILRSLRGLAESIPAVAELCRRPHLLDSILKLYKRGLLDDRSVQNASRVYEQLIQEALNLDDDDRRAPFTPLERRRIVRDIAFELFLKGESEILPEAVTEIILDGSTLPSDDDRRESLTSFEDTFLGNLHILVRGSKEHSYRFGHQTFLEYFVAEKAVAELRRGDISCLNHRYFYEEIYEFIGYRALEEDNGQCLMEFLGRRPNSDPCDGAIARLNVVPPMRKLRKYEAVPLLIHAHLHDPAAVVRYVCGYTTEMLLAENPTLYEDCKARLLAPHEPEVNAIVRCCTARILRSDAEGPKDELSPSFQYDPDDIKEIVSVSGVVAAYARILRLNREHPVILAESARILTLEWLTTKNERSFEAVCDFTFEHGVTHARGFVRACAAWSIGALSLHRIESPIGETAKSAISKLRSDDDYQVRAVAEAATLGLDVVRQKT